MELEQRFAHALSKGDSPLRDRVLAPLVQASPLLFAQLCLTGPPQSPFCGRLLFSAAHLDWEYAITHRKRSVIKASRGSGKSHVLTFINVLWRCATQPNSSGYIFSGTEFGAQRMLEEIKLEIEGNPKLAWLFPEGRNSKWTATQMRTSNGHHVVAKGMLTRVRGAHPSYIIGDDLLSDEDGWSQSKREKSKDYFYATITNMLLPGGSLLVTGTPQHASDLMADLDANPAYWSGTYPALTEDEESTWPEVYSVDYLLKLRQEIGSVRFDRERRCKPVSDSSSLFPISLFYQHDMMMPQAKLGAPADYWRSMGITEFYIGVDFALSVSVSADWWVLTVIGVDDHKNRWIVDIDRGRGLSFSEQKARIVTAARKYPSVVVSLEANAFQAVAANELKRQTDLPIRSYTTTSKKHSLTDGLPALRILLENGKFRFPRGDAHSVEMTDLLISEATNFTWIGGKATSIGGHDDTVFSLFLCETGIAKGSRVIVADADAQEPQTWTPAERHAALARHVTEHHQIHAAIPRSIVPTPQNAQTASTRLVYRNGVPVRV